MRSIIVALCLIFASNLFAYCEFHLESAERKEKEAGFIDRAGKVVAGAASFLGIGSGLVSYSFTSIGAGLVRKDAEWHRNEYHVCIERVKSVLRDDELLRAAKRERDRNERIWRAEQEAGDLDIDYTTEKMMRIM